MAQRGGMLATLAAVATSVIEPAHRTRYTQLADIFQPYADRPQLMAAALTGEPEPESAAARALAALSKLRTGSRGFPRKVIHAFDEIYASRIAELEAECKATDTSELRRSLQQFRPGFSLPIVAGLAEKSDATSAYLLLPNAGTSSALDMLLVQHLTGATPTERRTGHADKRYAASSSLYAVFLPESVFDAAEHMHERSKQPFLGFIDSVPHIYWSPLRGRSAPRRLDGTAPTRGKRAHQFEDGGSTDLTGPSSAAYLAFRELSGQERKPVRLDVATNRELLRLTGKDPSCYESEKTIAFVANRLARGLADAGAIKESSDGTYEVRF